LTEKALGHLTTDKGKEKGGGPLKKINVGTAKSTQEGGSQEKGRSAFSGPKRNVRGFQSVEELGGRLFTS